MGKEITTLPELNQYEAYNHAANVKLWLHDTVDSVKIASIVSLENVFKAIDSYFGITGLGSISFKANAAYDWTSTHDDDFFELQNNVEDLLTHNHDTDYAAKNKGLLLSYAGWTGNGAARQINLSGDICHHPIMMHGLAVGDTIPVQNFFWWPPHQLYVRRYYYNSWVAVETAFSSDPGSAAGFSFFNLIGTPINVSGVSYLLWAYGPESA